MPRGGVISSRRGFYRSFGKRCFDLIAAAILILLLLPALALVAVSVLIALGRPVFFRQARVGLGGRRFELVKFRTMSDLRSSDGNPAPDELRLGRLGRLLRRTSLDELPELWNVLVGDMSLVGPRPLLPEYVPFYTQEESLRHTVLPGLTGLAQTAGRNALSWDERLRLDAWYAKNLSLIVDLTILGRTLTTVLSGRGVERAPGLPMPKLSDVRPSPSDYAMPVEVAGEDLDGRHT